MSNRESKAREASAAMDATQELRIDELPVAESVSGEQADALRGGLIVVGDGTPIRTRILTDLFTAITGDR